MLLTGFIEVMKKMNSTEQLDTEFAWNSLSAFRFASESTVLGQPIIA